MDRQPEPKERALPEYESPKIEVMTEKDVLNTFQITQAMQTWWGTCP